MQSTCTLPPDSERNEKPAESKGKAEEKLLPAVTYCRWQQQWQQQRPATNTRNGKYDPELQNMAAKGSRMNVTTFARPRAHYTRHTLKGNVSVFLLKICK